jgi:signal transduction histidine kinase
MDLLAPWLERQTVSVPETSLVSESRDRIEEDTGAASGLNVLAGLAKVLAHTLEPEALARAFLLHVRDLLGSNRAAILLRDPRPDVGLFECVHATGLSRRGCTLSVTGGIGARLVREGRVLRIAEADDTTRREFAEFGAEYAIPVMDGQRLMGVALLDRRVNGNALGDRELTRLFRAFEMLGVALARARRHAAVAAAEALATGTLDQLETACVVITADESIAHCNPAARRLLRLGERPVLSDLPANLVTRIYTLLREGGGPERFDHVSKDVVGQVLEGHLKPVPMPGAGDVPAVLLSLSDVSARRAEQDLGLQAAGQRLVGAMAEHLAHEMGNALVPLSTGQQLLAADPPDTATLKGMEGVFRESVRRIERLAAQMQFLSREGLREPESVPVAVLLRDAFAEAGRMAKAPDAELILRGDESIRMTGERRALRQAMIEILLNALQSCTPHRVEVEWSANGAGLMIEVRDGGAGFGGRDRERATEPFYSGRTVGMGLGLTVARKLVQLHGGSLVVQPQDAARGGCVRLVLPDPLAEAAV